MQYKRKEPVVYANPENPTVAEALLNCDIQAEIIKSAKENLTTDVQDYDLILESGAQVVLHAENCGERVPQAGDYFHITSHAPFIFITAPKEFLKIYEPVNL